MWTWVSSKGAKKKKVFTGKRETKTGVGFL